MAGVFDLALGGFQFTFGVEHFLILVAIAVGILVLTEVVNYSLQDPFQAITWGCVLVIIVVAVLAYLGVFSSLSVEVTKFGEVVGAMITPLL